MTWLRFSLKEWRRRPLRTSITAAGVAIAIAALFSLLAFESGYRNGLRDELDHLGAHILIVPKGCPYDAASMALHGASWPCFLKQEYLTEVRSVPGVATAAPVFMAALSETNGDRIVYNGVQSDMLALKRTWHISGRFPQQEREMLVGSETARSYAWRLGDTVRLPGLLQQTGVISGILAPTQSADDTFIYLQLAAAQKMFGHSNQLTHILVRLTDPQSLERATAQLRGCDAGLSMNVVPLAHVFKTIQSLVASTRLFLGCLAAIGLLASAAGVSNAVLMAVAERRREIGIMRAIGASRFDVVRLISTEAIQVSFIGSVCGLLLAYAAARVVETWVRAQLPFAPADTLIRWQWDSAGACLVCALVVGGIAALFPACRAAQIMPGEAIRTGGGSP
ncbi:MAG TPA: ABC transporter permease [Candidatus Limnocylindrales bacterium]|jgi:putative ABC transport system permease protein|nr:ABC transporter permease [Candidatus Limnocylindrales bacterium]